MFEIRLDACLIRNPNINPKAIHLKNHPRQVLSRYRDPQFQVGENYSY